MSEEKPKKRKVGPRKREQSRREFIRTGMLAGGTLILALAGYLPVASSAKLRLRPPGALKDAELNEREFLAACIKCGQCVQVCPVEAIHVGRHFENAEYTRDRFVYDLDRLMEQDHPSTLLWDPSDPDSE